MLEFNRSASEARLRDLAVAMELDGSRGTAAEAAARSSPACANCCRSRHSETLGALGVSRDLIPVLAKRPWKTPATSRIPAVHEADMIALYEKRFERRFWRL